VAGLFECLMLSGKNKRYHLDDNVMFQLDDHIYVIIPPDDNANVLPGENLTCTDNTDLLCYQFVKSTLILNQAKRFLTYNAIKTHYFSLAPSHTPTLLHHHL
jgi:hypothetical protein